MQTAYEVLAIAYEGRAIACQGEEQRFPLLAPCLRCSYTPLRWCGLEPTRSGCSIIRSALLFL